MMLVTADMITLNLSIMMTTMEKCKKNVRAKNTGHQGGCGVFMGASNAYAHVKTALIAVLAILVYLKLLVM